MIKRALAVLLATSFSGAICADQVRNRRSCSDLLLPLVYKNLKPMDREATGIAEGFWVKDTSDGAQYFMKGDLVNDDSQTSNEVICSGIYRDFGYETARTEKVRYGRRSYSVSKEFKGVRGFTDFDGMNEPKWRQLVFYAAYLKDWDRIANKENNLELDDGSFALIDFGGALGSEATGNFKDGDVFSGAIGTFEATSNIHEIMDNFVWTANDGHPWTRFTVEDAMAAVREFQLLTNDQIENRVRAAKYRRKSDESYMINALEVRRDGMIKGLVEYVKEVVRRREQLHSPAFLSEQARRNALSKAGIKFANVDLYRDSDIMMVISPKNLQKAVVNSRGFKNLFETGRGTGLQSYGKRVVREELLFGIDRLARGAERPLYAILNLRTPIEVGERTAIFDSFFTNFGSIFVVFKDSVKALSSWTYGDTSYPEIDQVARSLGVSERSFIGQFSDTAIAVGSEDNSKFRGFGWEYLEAEIHRPENRPLTIDDVEYLGVLTREEAKNLREYGRPVYLMKQEYKYGRTIFTREEKLF